MTDPIVNALSGAIIGGAIVAFLSLRGLAVIARERDAYRRERWRLHCLSRNQQVEIMRLRQKVEPVEWPEELEAEYDHT